MKVLLSVPSGAHARTLLLPLKRFFEEDSEIDEVVCISPGAPYQSQLFPTYGEKFSFIENPLPTGQAGKTQTEHDSLAKNVAPDIIVTTTSGLDPNDPFILQAGKNNNIATLTFIESWDNVWKMERAADKQVIADHIIVWNTTMRDHFIRIWPELRNDRISIIGAPRLDYFFHTEKIPSREQLFHELGLNEIEKPLIHFSTTELYPFEYIIKTIYKAIQQGAITHKPHFYASVHPGGNLNNHQGLKKYGATVHYSFGRHPESPIKDFLYNPTEEELYLLVALFKHSNLLINHSSTTAIESLLGDVPVINVKYGRPWDFWHWKRSPVFRDFEEHYDDLINEGATAVVTNERELIQATQRYLDHPELDRDARAKTLKKMITTTDGTASEKVFQKIKQLAK